MSDNLPLADTKVPVEGYISPGLSDLNDWATHYAKYGRGGFEIVQSLSDMNAISDDRKVDKMVFIRDSYEFYQHNGTDWSKVPMGSSGGDDFILSIKDSAGTDSLGMDTLTFDSSLVEVDSLDKKEVRITPYVEFTSNNPQSEEPSQTSVLANAVSVRSPLEVYSDPNTQLGAEIGIKHASFEPLHNPAYLAYFGDNEVFIGKDDNGVVHESPVWPRDVYYPANAFIELKPAEKIFGIQEADELDPNVTGGTDYLLAFRMHMKGEAPSEGYVRAYFKDTRTNQYLADVNGELLVAQKNYKTDDKLGSLEVLGVVNAKGLTEIQTVVIDSFSSDFIVATDVSQGASGILIQSLTSDEKTSPALLQFESDTNQTIEFNGHYLGAERMSIGFIANTVTSNTIAANRGDVLNDGLALFTSTGVKFSSGNGDVVLSDTGGICDFTFGQVFDSEETLLLRGKDVKLTSRLINLTNGFNFSLVKWTGKPDEFTKTIIASRANGSPVFTQGWAEVDKLFVAEDVSGDHVVTKTFRVPSDANNYALIVYPAEAEQPMSLTLKQMDLDVVAPFNGYSVTSGELLNEKHLAYSEEYAKFVQDRQGYYSLRYTLNSVPSTGVPMPCGMLKKGVADISIDSSVNKVTGSSARGGEGALKFNKDGKAIVKTSVFVYPGEDLPQGDKTTARFWWAKVDVDGNFTKIDDSETLIPVAKSDPGALHTLHTFGIDVKAGDRIALLSLTDKANYTFIEAKGKDAAVTTEISFKELKLVDGSDDPFSSVDVSQFDTIYQNSMTVTKLVSGVSFTKFKFNLPTSANMVVLSAVKQTNPETVRPVTKLDWLYNNDTQELTVSFGETVTLGSVMIGVYL